MRVLITGGAGYIGSHTIIELINQGYNEVYSIDNFINSSVINYEKISQITGKKVTHYNIDLTSIEQTRQFFMENTIDAVIHFAALKSVPESVDKPDLYYRNNTLSLLNILKCMKEFNVHNIIFSSSCSIYGNPDQLPVQERTPLGNAESPYARTKQIGEMIIKDFCFVNRDFKAISLRYFNPAGAHPSGLIGEAYSKRPNNLVPIITQTAANLREKLTVFGSDYNTADGSCIRDYIHVMDVAKAHVKALEHLLNEKMPENYDIFNLGTGKGTSVLEIINHFESVNNIKVNYVTGDRRTGDVESIYADNSKASEVLGWNTEYTLTDMLQSAWLWQKNMEI